MRKVNSIMKVLIVFDTKYGNTQRVAELIADGFNSVDGNETEVVNVKSVDLNEEVTYDLIVIGSPNHVGKLRNLLVIFLNLL